MSEFNDVTVIKAANIYFDGKVTSRTVKFADGSHKTLGVMLPGDYSFNTEAGEIMEVLAGSMDIKLAGEENWNTYSAGTQFEVAENSSFDLKVTEVADYCCSYLA
ncbi:MAG: pyrimidine/purine nucleoside phosphorylase [Gammaproteobacteria bacterium]